MPIYEYLCPTCDKTFESLRSAPAADDPATCPSCQADTSQRILSLFAKSVNTDAGAALAPVAGGMGGCGCGGGACGCA